MNPSLAYTVLAMQKAAQTPPVNNNFLPMAGAGIGYMMGDGDMTDRLLPAGIGYFLANAYNNMTPEQRANLFAKSPELAQQAQQAAAKQGAAPAAGTIPEVAPGAAGAPDVHAKIRPEGLPANSTLHHIDMKGNKQAVWRVVGADGTQQLFNSLGQPLDQGSALYSQAATQIQNGQAPATYAGLPQNVKPLPTGLAANTQTVTGSSGTYVVTTQTGKNGKPIVDKNGRPKVIFSKIDANGALLGPSNLTTAEIADAQSAYNKIQPQITPAPKMTPGRGYIETGRGEWYNPKTQDVSVFDPKQGGVVSIPNGTPDYDRIRNAGLGAPSNAVPVINPLTGETVMAVPNPTAPVQPGAPAPKPDSYRYYKFDPKSGMGQEITHDGALGQLNAKMLGKEYTTTQAQGFVQEYKQLEAMKPTPQDIQLAKAKDQKAINKINDYNKARADLLARDAAANPPAGKTRFGAAGTPRGRMTMGTMGAGGAMAGALGGKLIGSMFGDEYEGVGAGLGALGGLAAGLYGGSRMTGYGRGGVPSNINAPLATVGSKMRAGQRFGGAAGATALGAGGLIAGTEIGKTIGKELGDEDLGGFIGGASGLLGGGIAGWKGGRRFVGNRMGESMGEVGRGSAVNTKGVKLDPSLISKTKMPWMRGGLGLLGAGAGLYGLYKYFKKNNDSPSRNFDPIHEFASEWNSRHYFDPDAPMFGENGLRYGGRS